MKLKTKIRNYLRKKLCDKWNNVPLQSVIHYNFDEKDEEGRRRFDIRYGKILEIEYFTPMYISNKKHDREIRYIIENIIHIIHNKFALRNPFYQWKLAISLDPETLYRFQCIVEPSIYKDLIEILSNREDIESICRSIVLKEEIVFWDLDSKEIHIPIKFIEEE